jgi:surfactin synthase thioesterase subunit
VNGENGCPRDVVAFPGAGSFGQEFRLLRNRLAGDARLVALQYPGRTGPDQGTPATSFGDLVAACVSRARERSLAGCVLAGHSFGAYVAYATASALEAAGTVVDALVVVGANAPDRLSLPEDAVRTREGAWEFLTGIGEDVVGPVPDEEWREIVMETAWRDLVLLSEFPGPAPARLHGPVLAVRGQDDPLTAEDRMSGWADTTDGEFALVSLPGGHSDVLAAPAFLDRMAALVTSRECSTRSVHAFTDVGDPDDQEVSR